MSQAALKEPDFNRQATLDFMVSMVQSMSDESTKVLPPRGTLSHSQPFMAVTLWQTILDEHGYSGPIPEAPTPAMVNILDTVAPRAFEMYKKGNEASWSIHEFAEHFETLMEATINGETSIGNMTDQHYQRIEDQLLAMQEPEAETEEPSPF